jgi:hypothetical protein
MVKTRSLQPIKNDFVILQLVVDDKAELDLKEQYTSTNSGKKIKTIGAKWSDLEADKFQLKFAALLCYYE